MDNLYIKSTSTSPEIHFSPEENIFLICGVSSPEDVRAVYFPAIEWIKEYVNNLLGSGNKQYSQDSPLRFRTDLKYFNSSSAKFLYDIYIELKRLVPSGIPFIIEWVYAEVDIDLREAGSDIAILADMEFLFVEKKSTPK